LGALRTIWELAVVRSQFNGEFPNSVTIVCRWGLLELSESGRFGAAKDAKREVD